MAYTDNDILKRLKEIEDKDFFGFTRNDLVLYLSYDAAKSFVSCTKEQWEEQRIEDPLEAVKNYLPFAWEKANDCRGLSAARSLDHLKAWLWLAGYGSLVDKHFESYSYYGKQQLVMASFIVGLTWREYDNGFWLTHEDDQPLPEKDKANLVTDAANAIRRHPHAA